MDMGCRPIGVTGFSCFLIIIVANQWVVLLYFFKDLFVSLVERVRVCAREHKSRGKEGVRERENLPAEQGAQCGAPSHNPEIMT